MKSSRLTPRRYQLKKEAAHVVVGGHPWVFRSHLSSAAGVFPDGQWLRLVGASNEVLGFGVYEEQGLIALRVLKRGDNVPDTQWVRKTVAKALAKREPLRNYSDAFRALHGENDNLPGIVVDVYGDTAVLQTYSPVMDSLGRYCAAVLRRELGLAHVVWKAPAKRKRTMAKPVRLLYGATPPEVKRIREGKLTLTVSVLEGQKSGAFLDLRGLRKWLAAQPLAGKRVLNLFSYTGTLGLACEVAGAREIWNVDVSQGALDLAAKHHALDRKKHKYIAADIFDWLPQLPPKEQFDVVIVDPPLMASETTQVPKALHAYRKLYEAAAPRVKPGGVLIAACCTARISRKRFEEGLRNWLPPSFKGLKKIAPEDDHPVAFPEGDYLKLLAFRQS